MNSRYQEITQFGHFSVDKSKSEVRREKLKFFYKIDLIYKLKLKSNDKG